MEDIQMDDNSPSVEHILRPITYTSWLLGVGVARPRKYPKIVTIIIRIIYSALCTTNVIHSLYEFYLFRYAITKEVFFFISLASQIIYYTSIYYCIYHGIRQYNKWPELMDRIKELDQKIKKETHINDQSIKNIEVVAILTTLACCLFYVILQILCSFEFLIRNVFDCYWTAQLMINNFVFDIIVCVLYYRCQKINKLLDQLDERSDMPWIVLEIKRIRELHYDICDLVIMINNTYGLHLFFCSINCFFIVLWNLYVINENIDDSVCHILTSSIFCMMYMMQIGPMCWICTHVSQEFDKTKIIISAISLKCNTVSFDRLNSIRNQLNLEMQPPLENADSVQNSNWRNSHNNLNYVVILSFVENFLCKYVDQECVRNEINDFSIQVQHRVAFTACNFFEINNVLFYTFTGMIFTYLVIMIIYYRSQTPATYND